MQCIFMYSLYIRYLECDAYWNYDNYNSLLCKILLTFSFQLKSASNTLKTKIYNEEKLHINMLRYEKQLEISHILRGDRNLKNAHEKKSATSQNI